MVWTALVVGGVVTGASAAKPRVDPSVATPTVTQTTTTIINRAFTEGVSETVPAGTLHDYDSGAPDCTAFINWGDGTTSPATLTPLGGGDFAASGTHTYAEEGAYATAGAQSTDPDCAAPSTTTTGTVTVGGVTFTATIKNVRQTNFSDTVNCCEPLAVTASPVTATAGSPFSGMVATFTDPDPAIPASSSIQENDGPSPGPPSSYAATVDWGDGTSSPGTVAAGGPGGLTVTGTHTYAAAGSFPLKVSVTDTDQSTGTGNATATVTAPGAGGTAPGAAGIPPTPAPFPSPAAGGLPGTGSEPSNGAGARPALGTATILAGMAIGARLRRRRRRSSQALRARWPGADGCDRR
jgi:hypothetical protein